MNQNHAKEFRETFPEENFDPTVLASNDPTALN
jgi:peroxidase